MFARLPVTPRRIPEGWGEAEREQFVAIADAMKNAQAAEVELVVLGVLGYVGRVAVAVAGDEPSMEGASEDGRTLALVGPSSPLAAEEVRTDDLDTRPLKRHRG